MHLPQSNTMILTLLMWKLVTKGKSSEVLIALIITPKIDCLLCGTAHLHDH